MQAFFETFREAAQKQDATRLTGLAHWESRSCATSEEDGLSSRTVPAHIRIFGKAASVIELSYRSATDGELNRIAEGDRSLYWPARPEGAIRVEFERMVPRASTLPTSWWGGKTERGAGFTPAAADEARTEHESSRRDSPEIRSVVA